MKKTPDPSHLSWDRLDRFIQSTLEEDIGNGDHTSLSCIPEEAKGKAELLIKEDCILAGLTLADRIIQHLDPELKAGYLSKDGKHAKKGEVVLRIEGKTRSLLSLERLLLNCIQRMSGIASLTRSFVDEVADLGVAIDDTRKTTPGMRALEKWAVRIGGGSNHRHGLYDMILLKDNHIDHAGGVEMALQSAKAYLEKKGLALPIEVEARDLDEVQRILATAEVDRIMLDNFSYEQLREAVELIDGRAITEASGGIDLNTVRQYAECGVDRISVGALTHSVPAIDMSMKASGDKR